ncbi:MAG: ROK family protein, partial [Clostridia bacterium]
KDLDKETFEKSMQDGSILEHLNKVFVKVGETYFVPSGTIHAICKGITIYEIQQNSNLTYRLFDFMRKDKNGNYRELHLKKAVDVSNLKKMDSKPLETVVKDISTNDVTATEEILSTCKYFSSTKYTFDGKLEINNSPSTFKALTFVCGEGEIESKKFVKGDTYIIKASTGKTNIKGKGEFLMAQVNKFYLSLDLGGTMIKGGIIDDEGKLIVKESIDTGCDGGYQNVEKNIVKLSNILLEKSGMTFDDMTAMGIGIPGMINAKGGIVTYANNLGWEGVHIVEDLKKEINLPIFISNDANVAALGEIIYGTGGGVPDAVMITLGTGVGSGIVANGELVEGYNSAGGEFGHTTLIMGGEHCTCGRKGCVEAYVSATALIRDTKRALMKNLHSKMWSAIRSLDEVTAKLPFDFWDTDETAKALIEQYIAYLGESLANIGNIFRPNKIILGGGISYQGEKLTKPVQEYVNKTIYAGGRGADVEIVVAKLKNDAGIFGACALCQQNLKAKKI